MRGATKLRKKTIVLLCITVVFLLCGSVAAWLVHTNRAANSSPFTKEITSGVDFPLYYPKPLPSGYALNKKSVGGNGEAVFYDLYNSAKKLTITVTLQATPSAFDAAKIIGSASIPTTIMPSGTLYNLSISGMAKYMFTTGDGTLIFITATQTIPEATVNTLARNLQQVK